MSCKKVIIEYKPNYLVGDMNFTDVIITYMKYDKKCYHVFLYDGDDFHGCDSISHYVNGLQHGKLVICQLKKDKEIDWSDMLSVCSEIFGVYYYIKNQQNGQKLSYNKHPSNPTVEEYGVNGKLNGESIFYDNHVITTKGYYIDNKLNGEINQYHENILNYYIDDKIIYSRFL